jgi:hypothetical protein
MSTHPLPSSIRIGVHESGAVPIINQPWEDVADDVTGAIEKAVQPLLKTAVDSIYSGLLDATQDYLKDNLAFNIASRIDVAEREAAHDRIQFRALLATVTRIAADYVPDRDTDAPLALCEMREALDTAIAAARGEA